VSKFLTPWSRRLPRLATAVVAAVITTSLLPGDAHGALSLPQVPQKTASPNGRVHAIVRVGDTVYLGGSFTAVRRKDGTTATRNRLAAINATTGELKSWNPNANGTVLALAVSADGSRIYAGGDFTAIGGRTRNRLAKISASSGSLSSWKPSASSSVRALAIKGSRLYAGGTFSTINGTPVSRLAALDTSSGSVKTDFQPRPDAGVRSLAVSPDGTRLYVAGSFTTIGGAARRNLAAVGLSSGSARSWAPNPDWFAYSVTVSSDGSRIYAGGAGTGGRVAAWKPSSNTPLWEKSLDGDANAVALTANALYAGGHFHVAVGQAREKLAAFDPASGALHPWNPGADSLAGVYAVTAANNGLHVGGDFTVIGGISQPRYAQFGGTP
jgi:trimeric autotransporter adhesin